MFGLKPRPTSIIPILLAFVICAILISYSSSASTSTSSNNHNPCVDNNECDIKVQVRESSSWWRTLDGSKPLIIAHRGEKVLLPEHTLPAYELASILGADYVEPDLCLTKDDVLVCYHDLFLGEGTDVASRPEFAHLKRNESGDHQADWYIRDFTVAQLKTLRIIQRRVGTRPVSFNGLFSIPTFQEYLNTIHRMIFQLKRTIGINPELKRPEFHNKDRRPHFMEDQLLQVLEKNGYFLDERRENWRGGSFNCHAEVQTAGTGTADIVEIHPIVCPSVTVQSFEDSALIYLHSTRNKNLELLQLVYDDPYMLTVKALQKVAHFATYYSVWKYPLYMGVREFLQATNKTWNETVVENMGGFINRDNFSQVIHGLGLRLVVYTIYDSRESERDNFLDTSILRHEQDLLDSNANVNVKSGDNMTENQNVKTQELITLLKMGVDGIFVENVAESLDLLTKFELEIQKKKFQSDCNSTSSAASSTFLLSLGSWTSGKISNVIASQLVLIDAPILHCLLILRLPTFFL